MGSCARRAHVLNGPRLEQQAACIGTDQRLFFPERRTADAVAEAKAICARCPVRGSCLLDALAGVRHPYDQARLETPGVAGGMTTAERRALRKTDRVAA